LNIKEVLKFYQALEKDKGKENIWKYCISITKDHVSFMCNYRASEKQHKEAEKCKAHFLKERRVIMDLSWEMTQELVAECSVPVTWVNKVIWTS